MFKLYRENIKQTEQKEAIYLEEFNEIIKYVYIKE